MYNFQTVMTSGSTPLTLETYTTFFLIPYIGSYLISIDKDTDIDGGWEIMQKSGDHGDTMNGLLDNDSTLDKVFAINARRRNAEEKQIQMKTREVEMLVAKVPEVEMPEVEVPEVKVLKVAKVCLFANMFFLLLIVTTASIRLEFESQQAHHVLESPEVQV
jgi:hypothetical protein